LIKCLFGYHRLKVLPIYHMLYIFVYKYRNDKAIYMEIDLKCYRVYLNVLSQ